MDNNREKLGAFARFQRFLDSSKGRTILNYMYSWGAAVVILGALFKLTHIGGANLMLFIGMGAEVLIFFISGFEKPYIPSDEEDTLNETPNSAPVIVGKQIIREESSDEHPKVIAIPTEGVTEHTTETIFEGSDVDGATSNYLQHITELTQRMENICRHTEKLEESAGEIETLTRHLISINTFYQMQLRSASAQMENLDRANEETKNMVLRIEELNRVYARMVEAMKVNIGSKE